MPEPFAQQLSRHRQRAGLSLRQLGLAIGVSFSTLARIERGDGAPDTHTRLAIERWLCPDHPHRPCPCVRCRPVVPVDSLDALTQRVARLEAQVARLEAQRPRAEEQRDERR